MTIMCFPSFFGLQHSFIIIRLANIIINNLLIILQQAARRECMVSACLRITLLCLFYYSILGENFDRQASLRRSLIYTDTLVRRPKKVKRRKTITGVPDNIQKELGMAHQNCILLPLVTAQHYYANLIVVLTRSIHSDSRLVPPEGQLLS